MNVKVLVAYDGSTQARRALDWAAHMARDGSTVGVIGVAPALTSSPKIADAVDPRSDVAEHRRQLDEAAATLAAIIPGGLNHVLTRNTPIKSGTTPIFVQKHPCLLIWVCNL